MRTRKMRLVSAILSLAMLFAVAPVSAFADEDDKKASGMILDASGYVDIQACNLTPLESDTDRLDGHGWYIRDSSKSVWIKPTYEFNKTSYTGSEKIENSILNCGTIKDGNFDLVVNTTDNNTFAGKIEGGQFTRISNSSSVENAVMETYTAQTNATLKNSIVLDWLDEKGTNTIESGILPKAPSTMTTVSSPMYEIEADGCTISGTYNDKKFSMKNQLCAVGTPAMTLTVTPLSADRKIANWHVDGLETEIPAGSDSVTLDIPADYTGKITVTMESEKYPLAVSNNLPMYGQNKDDTYGSPYDGWTYSETTVNEKLEKNLVVFDYTADIGDEQVDWTVKNNGTIASGKYTGKINNYGKIEGGTFSGSFVNRDAVEDDNKDATGEGTVENGVFSTNTDFGSQTDVLKSTWVNAKNGTVNEIISGMARVVGKQDVVVKPSFSKDLFRGWTYSGNISSAVEEQLEKQKNNYELTLTLDGDAEDSINLMPMIDGEPFNITMLDGKATVGDTDVTAAVPGQTVTLSIDDSEIPEGMSFDHWVISPDVELEGGFKATDRTTSFKMPAQELTIYASLRTDSDDGTDAMTIVAGVAIGAGAAVLTYHIGTELYAKQVLGDGVAVPKTREDVALKAWELAGKPAVELNGDPLSEATQAEKWAVESGLMQNDASGEFNGAKKMNKLKALRTLDAAKKLG